MKTLGFIIIVSLASGIVEEVNSLRQRQISLQQHQSVAPNHENRGSVSFSHHFGGTDKKRGPKRENELRDKKLNLKHSHTRANTICPNPITCVMKATKKTGNDRTSRQHETLVAVCHYDEKFDGSYKTMCEKEENLRNHFRRFKHDYCGVCIDVMTSSSSTTPWETTETTEFFTSSSSTPLSTVSTTDFVTPPTTVIVDDQDSKLVVKNITDTENDRCDKATPLTSTNMIIYGSTQFATTDFVSDLEETCGTPVGSKGVWFSILGNKRNAVIRIEYQLYSTLNGNSKLAIFKGSCGDLKCVANKEGPTAAWYAPDFNQLAVHEFIPESGKKYLLLLTGELPETVADYDLRISEYEIPVNNECEDAIAVSPFPVPEIMMGDNFGATPDFEEDDLETCGIYWDTRGVWYSVKGRGTIVRIEYQLNSYHQGKTELSVFTGPCDALKCVVNKEAESSPWYSDELNYLLVHEFFAEKGESYKFLLAGETFDTTGLYELKVSENELPSNDMCKNAAEIKSFNKIYRGSTVGATPDFTDSDLEKCGITSVDTRGVWYSLTGHGQSLRIEYQLNSYHQDYTKLSVFNGSCGDWSCVGNAEAAPSPWYSSDWNEMLSFEFAALEGEMYLLYLSGGSFETAGDYELIVSTL